MTNWTAFFDGIVTGRQIKENEPMSHHTTYGIGGAADVFVTPQNEEELVQILKKASAAAVPVTVIGGGSNCLVRDGGIRGITLCMLRMKPSMVRRENHIIASGGAGTGPTARFAWKEHLSGLEWAVGIPGTICGAAFMNANGYGGHMADVVRSVRCVTRDGAQFRKWSLQDIAYEASDSLFMKNGDIVLEVDMELHPDDPQEIQNRMNTYQQSRREKQPLDKRSAGTMFLRPPGHYVGPMIKACGLMGFAVGDAQVSLKHPDFVVNNGHATCSQVLAVLHEVQKRVQEKYHVYVPLDVRILGEDKTGS